MIKIEEKQQYRVKMIKSGQVLEFIYYDLPKRTNSAAKRNGRNKREVFDNDYCQRRYNQELTKIKRAINANNQFNKHLTLTFKENLTDINICNKIFHKFIRSLRQVRGDFDYLSVIEFQERGAVHYHVLTNMEFMRVDRIAYIWSKFSGHLGGVHIEFLYDKKNLAEYFTQYVTKECADGRLYGKKKFFHSLHLKKSEILFDEAALDYFQYCSDKIILKEKKSIAVPFIGTIVYEVWNIVKQRVLKVVEFIDQNEVLNCSFSQGENEAAACSLSP